MRRAEEGDDLARALCAAPRTAEPVLMRICLPVLGSVAAWRQEARRLARAGIPSEAVLWQVGEDAADLFAAQELPRAGPPRLPRGRGPFNGTSSRNKQLF